VSKRAAHKWNRHEFWLALLQAIDRVLEQPWCQTETWILICWTYLYILTTIIYVLLQGSLAHSSVGLGLSQCSADFGVLWAQGMIQNCSTGGHHQDTGARTGTSTEILPIIGQNPTVAGWSQAVTTDEASGLTSAPGKDSQDHPPILGTPPIHAEKHINCINCEFLDTQTKKVLGHPLFLKHWQYINYGLIPNSDLGHHLGLK
jgi:hypothetical protein